MTAPLVLQGRWWLPEHANHQVFGTLTWDVDEGGRLLLQDELPPVVWLDNVLADGSVQRYRSDRGDAQHSYPLIRGQVAHQAYTLLDSFRLSAREYDEDERTETVHVNRFLEGAWFDDPDELRVDQVNIDMRHLTGWVNRTGLEVEWPQSEGDDTDVFAVVTASTLPPLEAKGNKVILRLTQAIVGTGDHIHALGMEQRWTLRLRTSATEPLDVPLEVASEFQHLVSIAVGQTAQFERVVLHHPDLPALSLAGTPLGAMRQDITYYVRWSNRTAPHPPVRAHDMYFTFDDLGGIEGVERWLAVAADYRTELNRVMATRYSKAMVLEDRIMNVTAALDSFDQHRRSTGKKRVNFATRVEKCVDFAGQPFLDLIAADPKHWIRKVVDARNDLAHHRESFRATGGAGDYFLAEQLFWLFTVCMLRLADAPPEVFERIAEHRQTRWLTEKARSPTGTISD